MSSTEYAFEDKIKDFLRSMAMFSAVGRQNPSQGNFEILFTPPKSPPNIVKQEDLDCSSITDTDAEPGKTFSRSEIERPIKVLLAKSLVDSFKRLNMPLDTKTLRGAPEFMKKIYEWSGNHNSESRKRTRSEMESFINHSDVEVKLEECSETASTSSDQKSFSSNLVKTEKVETEHDKKVRGFVGKLIQRPYDKRSIEVGKLEDVEKVNSNMVRNYRNVVRTEDQQERRDKNTKAARLCRKKDKIIEEIVNHELDENLKESIRNQRILAAYSCYEEDLLALRAELKQHVLEKTGYIL